MLPRSGRITPEKNCWHFPSILFKKREKGTRHPTQEMPHSLWEGEDDMIGKRICGLMAAVFVFIILAWPLAAADKTVHLDVPGCSG
jgi:hypothetical protein